MVWRFLVPYCLRLVSTLEGWYESVYTVLHANTGLFNIRDVQVIDLETGFMDGDHMRTLCTSHGTYHSECMYQLESGGN